MITAKNGNAKRDVLTINFFILELKINELILPKITKENNCPCN